MARRLRRRAGQQRHAEGHVGAGVGDERLLAVDHPAAVAPLGPGADAAGVGTGVGLGQAEGPERPALGQRSQPALPLLVVAEQEEGQRPDRHVGLPGRGHRLVGQADLLHGGDEADRGHPDPAPLLGDQHAEQPQLAHLPQEVGRADRVLPRLGRSGRDLVLREVAAEPDQVALGLGQGEVHGPIVPIGTIRSRARSRRRRAGRRRRHHRHLPAAPGPRGRVLGDRCSRPATASAAPGTGTATPGPGSTRRATPTPTCSPRSCSTTGSGRSTSPSSPRPSATSTTSSTGSTSAATCASAPRSPSAVWDEPSGTWVVTVGDGTEVRARFLVAATGVLSVPYFPDVPGREDFRGESAPHRPLAGGAASTSPASGSPSSAPGRAACRWSPPSLDEVASLTVYQRTANWCTPLNNAPITAEEQAQLRADFEALREVLNTSIHGFHHPPHDRGAFDDPDDERRAFFEKMWASPGFTKLTSNYTRPAVRPVGERRVVRLHRREGPRHRRGPRRPPSS